MDDEKRRFVRIDPHKIQQKIYDLYPANSKVRRNVIADAKALEIKHLSEMIDTEPVQITKIAIKKNRSLIFIAAFFGVNFLIASTVLFVYGFVFHKTTVELILSIVLGGIFLKAAFNKLQDAMYLREASLNFSDAIEKIKKKIDELSK